MFNVTAPPAPGTTRVCRLCLTDQGHLHCIFGGELADLAEQIYDITAIEIDDICGIPALICELCRALIMVSHRFGLQCRVSDVNYKKLLEGAPVRRKGNDLRRSTDSFSSRSGIGECTKDFGRPAKVIPVRSLNYVDEIQTKKRLPDSPATIIKVEPIDPNQEAPRDGRKKRCPKCNRMVIHLRNHLNNMHTEAPRHVCRICGKIFKHLQSLGCHMNSHNGIKPYSCRHCGKCYSHHNSLYEHEKYHEKRYRCSVCNAAFTHVRVMMKHVQMHNFQPMQSYGENANII